MNPSRPVTVSGAAIAAAALWLSALAVDASVVESLAGAPPPTLWQYLGGPGRVLVVLWVAVVVAAAYRPPRPLFLARWGGLVSLLAGVGAVGFFVGTVVDLRDVAAALDGALRSAGVPESASSASIGLASLLLVAGSVMVVAGSTWDLITSRTRSRVAGEAHELETAEPSSELVGQAQAAVE